MELISTAEFLAWAAGQGIGWDPRYPRARQLSYLAAPGHWRSWESPRGVEGLGFFVEAVLRLAAVDAARLWVFPRADGRWHFGGAQTLAVNQALDVVARGAGVPPEFVGAVRFAAAEHPRALALAVASLVFGTGTREDLYLLPSNGSCILMTSHDREIYGSFPSLAALEGFTAALVPPGDQC